MDVIIWERFRKIFMENKEKKMNIELGNKLDDIFVVYGWFFDRSEYTFYVICIFDLNIGFILIR